MDAKTTRYNDGLTARELARTRVQALRRMIQQGFALPNSNTVQVNGYVIRDAVSMEPPLVELTVAVSVHRRSQAPIVLAELTCLEATDA